MKATATFVAVLILAVVAVGGRANAQLKLPDGPNSALAIRVCTTCHDLGMVVGTGGRTRAGWESTIEDMTSYGMSISAAERNLVLEYLATYLPAPAR